LTLILCQRSRVPICSWKHPDGDFGPIPYSIILGTGTMFQIMDLRCSNVAWYCTATVKPWLYRNNRFYQSFYRHDVNQPPFSSQRLLDVSCRSDLSCTVKSPTGTQSPRVMDVTVKTQFGCRTLAQKCQVSTVPSRINYPIWLRPSRPSRP
jgi:hypothetical protein